MTFFGQDPYCQDHRLMTQANVGRQQWRGWRPNNCPPSSSQHTSALCPPCRCRCRHAAFILSVGTAGKALLAERLHELPPQPPEPPPIWLVYLMWVFIWFFPKKVLFEDTTDNRRQGGEGGQKNDREGKGHLMTQANVFSTTLGFIPLGASCHACDLWRPLVQGQERLQDIVKGEGRLNRLLLPAIDRRTHARRPLLGCSEASRKKG
jgi:hypothetical protein